MSCWLDRSSVPTRVPSSSLGVASVSILVGNVGIFFFLDFLWVLSFPQFRPTNTLHFSIPHLSHFTFSFIHFRTSFTSFTARFDAPLVYDHTGCGNTKRWARHVLLHVDSET